MRKTSKTAPSGMHNMPGGRMMKDEDMPHMSKKGKAKRRKSTRRAY